MSFIGDYQVIGQIGAGTYARVYKCCKNDNFYCIKVIKNDKPHEVKAAREEISALEKLKGHPNIVQLVEWFALEKEKEIAIVLEYMDCADLSHILSHHQIRLSIAQCKYIMQQILQGLASMHSCKLMHRDIKVPNILLNKHGQVKLGDLGCTTSFQNRSIFSNTVCTLWYRAPELLMGTRTYDDKVDIWSAACVFTELITKRNFIRGVNEEQQLEEILRFFGTPDLRSMAPNLSSSMFERLQSLGNLPPSGLEYLRKAFPGHGFDFIMSMFRIDPKERPSAMELLAHPFFRENPLPADPTTLPVVDGLQCFQEALYRSQMAACQPQRPKPIIRRFSPSSRSSSPTSPRHVTFDLPIMTVYFDKEDAPCTIGALQAELSPPPTRKRSREEEVEWSDDDMEEDDPYPPSKRPRPSSIDYSNSSTASESSPQISPAPSCAQYKASASANPFLTPPRVERPSRCGDSIHPTTLTSPVIVAPETVKAEFQPVGVAHSAPLVEVAPGRTPFSFVLKKRV